MLPGWNLSHPTSDFYKVNTSTPPFMEEVLELIHFIARYTSKVGGESYPGTFFSLYWLQRESGWLLNWRKMRGVPTLLLALPRNSGSTLLKGCVYMSAWVCIILHFIRHQVTLEMSPDYPYCGYYVLFIHSVVYHSLMNVMQKIYTFLTRKFIKKTLPNKT